MVKMSSRNLDERIVMRAALLSSNESARPLISRYSLMASVHFFGWPKDQDITWTYGDGNIRRPHDASLPYLAVKLKMSEEEEDDVEDPEPREHEELETSSYPPPDPEPDAAIPHKKKFKIVTRPNPNVFRDWNASSEDESYVTDDD